MKEYGLDLSSYAEVKAQAENIYARLIDGSIRTPCAQSASVRKTTPPKAASAGCSCCRRRVGSSLELFQGRCYKITMSMPGRMAKPVQVYQIKVTLCDSHPPIWRIQVRSDVELLCQLAARRSPIG